MALTDGRVARPERRWAAAVVPPAGVGTSVPSVVDSIQQYAVYQQIQLCFNRLSVKNVINGLKQRWCLHWFTLHALAITYDPLLLTHFSTHTVTLYIRPVVLTGLKFIMLYTCVLQRCETNVIISEEWRKDECLVLFTAWWPHLVSVALPSCYTTNHHLHSSSCLPILSTIYKKTRVVKRFLNHVNVLINALSVQQVYLLYVVHN